MNIWNTESTENRKSIVPRFLVHLLCCLTGMFLVLFLFSFSKILAGILLAMLPCVACMYPAVDSHIPAMQEKAGQ